MLVRPATAADLPAMCHILNDIIDRGGMTAIEARLSEADMDLWFVSGDDVLLSHVAVERASGAVLGFQAVSRHPDLPVGWGDIATFTRLEPYVPGVGRRLFAVTAERARQAGLSSINAAIRADNTSGLTYYARMGFVAYRTLHAVPLRDGTPVDRILKRYDVS
nr:hypothetical protein [Rhizobium sp. RU36D]